MKNVKQTVIKNSGRTVALALALAPFGAAAAQQPRPATRPHAQACANGPCSDDSVHLVVLRLMDKVDSLQSIFLGQPISAEQREQMRGEIEGYIRKLTDLQQRALTFGLQQAAEGMSQAMAEGDMAHARMQVQIAQDAAPKGWIGLTFVGAQVDNVRDGEVLVHFLDYPEVETVEPSSPAERAGIMRGDLLMAFNGQDVTAHTISMSQLLQPDRKVVVRLQRNGEPRDYTLVVAKAPQTYTWRIGDFTAPRPPMPPAAAAATAAVAAAPTPMPAPVFVRKLPNGVVVSRSPSVFTTDPEHVAVGGAEMNALNPDLARNLHLGVDHGVMVMNAPVGTPAADAGLQDGDIILKVADEDVSTVSQLRRALQRRAGDATFDLLVLRDRHKQTIKVDNN